MGDIPSSDPCMWHAHARPHLSLSHLAHGDPGLLTRRIPHDLPRLPYPAPAPPPLPNPAEGRTAPAQPQTRLCPLPASDTPEDVTQERARRHAARAGRPRAARGYRHPLLLHFSNWNRRAAHRGDMLAHRVHPSDPGARSNMERPAESPGATPARETPTRTHAPHATLGPGSSLRLGL